MERRAVYQTFAWFNDLHQRGLLDLDPPYQRRSVWNDRFKGFFLDTVLNNFPCPAIFLYEDISPEGVTKYKVVDGKQRLTTLLAFVNNDIAVPDDATIARLRGKSFSELSDQDKRVVWRYQLAVEHIPQENEAVIQDIFDRINRNVSKLTPQELRHAKFQGAFITELEEQSEWMNETLPRGVPNIAAQSRRQMKDVELIATLYLFLEHGEQSTGQPDLDQAFSSRDESWERRSKSTDEFRAAMKAVVEIFEHNDRVLANTRLRNQADFYSLFAAVAELQRKKTRIDIHSACERVEQFLSLVDDADVRNKRANAQALAYYNAARSASNDPSPRRARINAMKELLVPANV